MSTDGTTVDTPTKKKLSFPSAYTVLFCVAALVAMLTWFVDAGGVYNKLSYEGESFMITFADGSTETLPATQETLDKVGIKADLEKFVNGDIYKPVGIPNSYTTVDPNPQGIMDLFQAPIQGMYQSIDVVFFVLVIGGFIGIVNHSGAFGSGINRLSQVMAGREKWLIVIVTA